MLTAIFALLLVVALAACLYLALSATRLVRYLRQLNADRSAPPPELRPAFINEGAALAAGLVRELELSTAATEAEHDRLQASIEASSSGILAVSADGTVALCNSAARELLRPNEINVGMPLARAIRDHEMVASVETSRLEKRPVVATVEYGPERRPLQVNVDPLPESGGWSALLVLNDLSEVRRIERTRREFVSNVSHELRTPLAAVRAAVETLEDGALEDASAARSFLTSIHTEVDRMTQMVEELLELSKIESGAMPFDLRPVDLASVVKRAVERIRPEAERKGLNVRIALPAALPSIAGDAPRLEQALFNLLQNAVRFTDAGGAVEVAARSEGAKVTVSVTDSGPGIVKQHLPHIFERFYKADRARSSDGIGLGLAIVKHTVQAHGGSVQVESEVGRGSTFSLVLPAAEES